MRYLWWVMGFVFTTIHLQAQIRVEGQVTGANFGKVEDIPFANIVLKNPDDSTKIEFATLTDMQGNYFFESVPMKTYLLEISFLGYKTLIEPIEVVFPEVGNSIKLDYTLTPDDKLLNEVIVTANTVQKGIDKTTYLITSADMKSARFSMDLLEIIPSVSIDPVSQKIVSAKGKSIKILIDGISSSEIDLKAIPPNKVSRMEYYDVPPARYISYDAVINVITKNLDDGLSAGTTLQHAFTTGFINDDVFIKFIRGGHQISADYTLNYRNYSDVKTAKKYDYLIDDKPVVRNENSINPFGYTDHFINLKYTCQKPDKYVFQAKLSPNVNLKHSENNSEIQILQNESLRKRSGTGFDKSNTFNPVLNLYYWKQLKRHQTITLDVLGSLFSTRQNVGSQEWLKDNQSLELDDKMDLHNRKRSFIGEFAYNKRVGQDKISFGSKLETYNMDSKVTNSFDNKNYNSSFFADYLYGEYTGFFDKFMYRLNLGLMYKKNDNAVNRYSSWIFRPLALLGYKINGKNSIRLVFGQMPEEPDISEQSDNVIFVTDHILRKGNPSLRNSLTQLYYLNYGFVNKRFELELDMIGAVIKDKISSYYIKNDDHYLLTSLNDRSVKMYGLAYSGTIKPFGNNFLTFKFNGEFTKYFVKNAFMDNFTHWYMPLRYDISMKPGKFVVSYQGTIVSKDLSGTYLSRDENNSHFTVRYTQKNFSVWGNLLFAFTTSKYVTETIPASLVEYSSFRNIYDNKNMFTLGFSYTFSSGKKYEEQGKLINNQDSDSGLFK